MQNTPSSLKGLYISTNPLYITQEPITRRPTSSCQRCFDWIVPSFSHQRGHYSKLAYKFKPGQMDLSHSTRLHRLPDRLRQHCVMEIRHLSRFGLGQLLYEWWEERLRCLQYTSLQTWQNIIGTSQGVVGRAAKMLNALWAVWMMEKCSSLSARLNRWQLYVWTFCMTMDFFYGKRSWGELNLARQTNLNHQFLWQIAIMSFKVISKLWFLQHGYCLFCSFWLNVLYNVSKNAILMTDKMEFQ